MFNSRDTRRIAQFLNPHDPIDDVAAAMLGPAIVCFLALGVVSSNGIRRQRQYPPGHMEPLGDQRPMEGRVERVPSGVTPFEFFSRYVETATPVVLTRAINGTVPHSEWTDMYLKLVKLSKD